MKEYVLLIFKRIIRQHKRTIINSLIICLLFLFIFCAFSFLYTFNNYKNKNINKNIFFRSIVVYFKDSSVMSIDDQVKEINSINHVSFVPGPYENEVIVNVPQFITGKLDGNIYLLASNNNTLPSIIKGRTFTEDETGVLICSYNFLPDSDGDSNLNYKSSDYILDDKLLNMDLKISYSKYNYNANDYKSSIVQTLNENFKIVGIFDPIDTMISNNYCFANYKDVARISKIINNNIIEVNGSYPSIYIITDDINNVDNVLSSLKELGYEATIKSQFDNDFIIAINFIVVILTCLSTFVFFIMIIVNTKKSFKEQKKEMMILKTIGYSNEKIMQSLLIEQITILMIGFVLAVILYTCIYVLLIILANYVYLNIKYLNFNYPFLIMLISLILDILIIYFINLINSKQLANNSIIDNISE